MPMVAAANVPDAYSQQPWEWYKGTQANDRGREMRVFTPVELGVLSQDISGSQTWWIDKPLDLRGYSRATLLARVENPAGTSRTFNVWWTLNTPWKWHADSSLWRETIYKWDQYGTSISGNVEDTDGWGVTINDPNSVVGEDSLWPLQGFCFRFYWTNYTAIEVSAMVFAWNT